VGHDERPRDGEVADDAPRRGAGGRPEPRGRNSARVAAAAKAAAEGLRGGTDDDGRRLGAPHRSPGVAVLFEPAPASEPSIEAAVGSPADARTAGAEVWNPFRQRRSADPRPPDARPVISNLHTRRSATETHVIATLEHRGRRSHGTAAGPATVPGRLRAVAEATVAALQVVTDEPLPIGVDHVTSSDDEPGRVEVVVTWATGAGDRRLVGTAPVDDGPERAVMQATLDALDRCIEPFLDRPTGR
jgi:hypothetical protein